MDTDEVIKNLEDMVDKKIPVSPQWYVEQSQKLVALMSNDTDKLYELQREVAKLKVTCIEKGDSVATAKIRLEATELYQEMQKQKAKCERINEIIRIAKIQARMRQEEYKSNF